ncbi:polysaccharide deacetylase family protein [Paenibacillus sp. GCM10027627]|uniref:polysaccharide deacetylase family protein n=1 Tax=unclassified Paenibacillus TaxID=185978 RepID=UPI00363DCD23
MENLFLWGFYVMTFYAFLPGLISRTFGFRVFKKGRVKKEIALTFDDGPDPVYTPQLLDLLARYDAKATFFVVGSHAEGQLDLLRRMKEEGHSIGIHNYVHKSNWFMRPGAVRRQIEKTNDMLEQAVGQRSNLYRPPWGIINLFDYSNLGHMQIILWSAMFGDWRLAVGAERLKRRMLKKMRPGEVLLLHDCGITLGADKDAPRNMLIALEAYLEEATQKGFTFVGIDKMMKLTDEYRAMHRSFWKKAIISLWLLWERAFHFAFRLKQVGDSDDPTFFYRVTPYNGEEHLFSAGGSVKKGDLVAELHFDNRKLSNLAAQSKTPVITGIKLIREIEKALPLLANQLLDEPKTKEIKAAYGVTMIHRGADKLGFEVFDMPEGLFAKSSRIYLKVLMKVLTNSKAAGKSKSRRDRSEAFAPRMLFMPIQTLLGYATVPTRLSVEGEYAAESAGRIRNEAAEEAASLGTNTTAI